VRALGGRTEGQGTRQNPVSARKRQRTVIADRKGGGGFLSQVGAWETGRTKGRLVHHNSRPWPARWQRRELYSNDPDTVSRRFKPPWPNATPGEPASPAHSSNGKVVPGWGTTTGDGACFNGSVPVFLLVILPLYNKSFVWLDGINGELERLGLSDLRSLLPSPLAMNFFSGSASARWQ